MYSGILAVADPDGIGWRLLVMLAFTFALGQEVLPLLFGAVDLA